MSFRSEIHGKEDVIPPVVAKELKEMIAKIESREEHRNHMYKNITEMLKHKKMVRMPQFTILFLFIKLEFTILYLMRISGEK